MNTTELGALPFIFMAIVTFNKFLRPVASDDVTGKLFNGLAIIFMFLSVKGFKQINHI